MVRAVCEKRRDGSHLRTLHSAVLFICTIMVLPSSRGSGRRLASAQRKEYARRTCQQRGLEEQLLTYLSQQIPVSLWKALGISAGE